MAWKLLCSSSSETYSIENETILGRGPQFQIADKRVSRNHALLLPLTNGLQLKSTHKNPCFYKKHNDPSRGFQSVWNGESVDLQENDMIRLTNDGVEFSVVKNNTTDSTLDGQINSAELVDSETDGQADLFDSAGVKLVESVRDISNGSLKFLPVDHDGQSYDGADEKISDSKPAGAPAAKRRRLSESDEAGTLQPDSSQTDSQPVEQPTDDWSQSQQARTKCQYGQFCYRRNPVHFQFFSHPGDDDYDDNDDGDDGAAVASSSSVSVDRPDCPYGARCYRKNTQHRLEYQHPDSTGQRRLRGKAVKQKRDNGTADSDEYESDFIDDESEEDDDGASDSDDPSWQPAGRDDGDGGDVDNEADDDLELLQREARAFTQNRKS